MIVIASSIDSPNSSARTPDETTDRHMGIFRRGSARRRVLQILIELAVYTSIGLGRREKLTLLRTSSYTANKLENCQACWCQ